MNDTIDIVFDDGPGPVTGRFVEVESPPGTGIAFGEWVHRDDGYWALRIADPRASESRALALAARVEEAEGVARSIEWVWGRLGDRKYNYHCPACRREKAKGHADGCALAALLAKSGAPHNSLVCPCCMAAAETTDPETHGHYEHARDRRLALASVPPTKGTP